jgi:hypothetical protein
MVIKEGTLQETTFPYTLTDQELACTTSESDPRVTGTGTFNLNFESWYPNGDYGVAWAYHEIKGPDGTWAGRTYGLYDQDGVFHNYSVLVGSGAYKGLIYAVVGTVPAGGTKAETVGWIQAGTPPPGFPVTPFPAP